MNKLTLKLVTVSSLAVFLSGCSLFFTDHSDDYQDVAKTHSSLDVPEGVVPSEDVLVIPNEESISELTSAQPFVTPRAPFIYHPMVAVGVVEKEDAIEFSVPTNKVQTKQIVTEFLTALYGAGESISTQTQDQIISADFDFNEQGWWASLWSDITRVYPINIAFAFEFSEYEGNTLVSVQFREEVQGSEPTSWMTPIENVDAYRVAVRLWGTLGRLNQSSAYLSNRNSNDGSSYPVWVDHRGDYAIRLNDTTLAGVTARLKTAGIYFVPDTDNLISFVPPEKIARIGDIIDFSIPVGNGETKKLFNVYRRDLDDVSWEFLEYPYKIRQQKAGAFFVIDTSSANQPEVASFHFAQRFIN